MSYISSYVQTAPVKQNIKVVKEVKRSQKSASQPHPAQKKDIRVKIFLFIAILSCVVLAVNL